MLVLCILLKKDAFGKNQTHFTQTVNLNNAGSIPAFPTNFKNDIFIYKLYIMSKSHKAGKPKANRGNQVKKISLIKKNEEILSRLKNQ